MMYVVFIRTQRKIQVSFAEYHLFYRSLLQKRLIFVGSLLARLKEVNMCKSMFRDREREMLRDREREIERECVCASSVCEYSHTLCVNIHTHSLQPTPRTIQTRRCLCKKCLFKQESSSELSDFFIGHFCRIQSLLQDSFAKETDNLTDRLDQNLVTCSHPH